MSQKIALNYNTAGFPFLTSDLKAEESSSENESRGFKSAPEDTKYHDDPVSSAKKFRSKSTSMPKKQTKSPPPALQKAAVIVLAYVQQQENNNDAEEAERQILAKIVKCREKGKNETTPHAEAQTALAMASKLMTQHNISYAEIQEKTSATKAWERGESKVRITRKRGKSLRVSKDSWIVDVAWAMTNLFDVQHYISSHKHRSRLDYTFCGIAQNTRMAAQAFEVVFNLLCDWARDRKRSANNYRRGLARGFANIAKETKKQEKQAIVEAERIERVTRIRKEHLNRQQLINRLKHEPAAAREGEGNREIKAEDHKHDGAGLFADAKRDMSVKVEEISDDDKDILKSWLGSFSDGIDTDSSLSMLGGNDAGVTASGFHSSFSMNRDQDEASSEGSSEDTASDDWSDDGDGQGDVAGGTQVEADTEGCDTDNDGDNAGVSPAASALEKYRLEAHDIAKEMLEEKFKGRKGRKGRKVKYYDITDRNAYEGGIRDARDIDVKRKRIEDEKSEAQDVEIPVKRPKRVKSL